MPGEEALTVALKTLLDRIPAPQDPDDLFLNLLARVAADAQGSVNKVFLLAKTDFQINLRKLWRQRTPDLTPQEFLKRAITERTAQDVKEASTPFFRTCAEKGVHPFSLMRATKKTTLTPRPGYSEAHVAALALNLPKLKELFKYYPPQFEENSTGRNGMGSAAGERTCPGL